MIEKSKVSKGEVRRQENEKTWNETANDLYDTAVEIAKEAGNALREATSPKKEKTSEEYYH